MTNIVSYPCDLGRGPTKSIAISSNRFVGIGIGCSNPAGRCVDDLFCAHEVQDLMYVSTSAAIPGQYNSLVIDLIVFVCPKWFDLSWCNSINVFLVPLSLLGIASLP